MNNTEKDRATDECKKRSATQMKRPQTRPHLRTWIWAPVAAVFLAGILVLFPILKPTTVQAQENLMEGYSTQKQAIPEAPGTDFVSAQTDFAVKLLQKTAGQGKNSLISPTSVALALGMTANGAKGSTLSQFEALLGGGMDLNALDRDLASEQAALKSSTEGRVLLANSIWFRDKNLTVLKPFLQVNADYFGADAFRLDFSNPATPKKINAWVKENTGGKIDKIVEKIAPEDAMYLINTLYLEQSWKDPYNGSIGAVFHASGGDRNVKMMRSMETYLHDERAEGILKPLKDSRFAFAAILPKGGTDLSDYIADLNGKELTSLLLSAGDGSASTSLPKFKYDCAFTLNDALISLGLSAAFDAKKADFSAMGSSSDGNLFISEVLHKTFIEVDELGIKGGAATAVDMASGSSLPERYVVFDRPFLIAVVDTQTMLPVFLGAVSDPSVG